MKGKQSRRYSIDELRAFKLAYGRSIQQQDYLMNILMPAALSGGMTFLILHYITFSIVMGIAGGLFGYFILFPGNMKRFYEIRAFEQRNNFINTVTQLRMAPNVSLYSSLIEANKISEGDFKKQLTQLIAQLSDASIESYHAIFEEFRLIYAKDVIFSQYIDILETIAIEGTDSSESLKKVTSFHNDIKNFQAILYTNKVHHMRYVKTGQVLITCAILVFHLNIEPITYKNYVTYFSHNIIGWITYGIYATGMLITFTKLAKSYFDDDVLEVDL